MSSSCCCHRSWYQVYSFQKRKSTITKHNSRALGLHEKVVEGIESQGLKATLFDKVVLLQNVRDHLSSFTSTALQVSEDPPETVVHELTEFVQSNGGDGVVFFPYLG